MPYYVKSKNGKMIFGNKIRGLRESHGTLMRQLAAFLEVDTATISKIERGERNISIINLKKISSALDISISELFNFDNE